MHAAPEEVTDEMRGAFPRACACLECSTRRRPAWSAEWCSIERVLGSSLAEWFCSAARFADPAAVTSIAAVCDLSAPQNEGDGRKSLVAQLFFILTGGS